MPIWLSPSLAVIEQDLTTLMSFSGVQPSFGRKASAPIFSLQAGCRPRRATLEKIINFGLLEGGIGADEFQNINAVEPGHQQIEDDKVGAGLMQRPHGRDAVLGNQHFKPCPQQGSAENLDDVASSSTKRMFSLDQSTADCQAAQLAEKPTRTSAAPAELPGTRQKTGNPSPGFRFLK